MRGKSVYTEAEARELLFKPLDITSATITFDGQTCHDVTFSSEDASAIFYLTDKYQIMPGTLGIEEQTIQVIKTNCHLPGFDEYIRLADRRLLVSIQGILFVFKAKVDY